MGFLSQSFDINELPVSQEYGVLPAGWYSVSITKADVKPTKAGTGEYINLMYTVTGPTHQGRTVWGIINIRNPNPKAEEIGRQQLGELMRAIGLAKVQNTDQLIGKDLVIKLAVKDDDRGGERNDVKGFKAVQGGAMPSMPSIPSAPEAPSAKAAPPWAKK
jgi:hypothetical protein